MNESTSPALNRRPSPFDDLRQTRPDGTEFWSARELMPPLGYDRWENFEAAINRAEAAAIAQGHDVITLFRDVTKKGAGRPRTDVELARFACYLVAMNGDPRKPEVASAQAYFAIRTREAETAAPALSGAELLAHAVLEAQQMLAAKDQQIAELAPKAELADNYLTASAGSRLIGEAAKIIGLREKELRAFLLEEKLIFVKHAECGSRIYVHYADYAAHFEARETVVNHTWGSCNHYTLRITPRGIDLIRKRIRRAEAA